MFKSLLYTIPTLSGNVSISCALNQNRYNSSTNEYDSFVQAANLVPLQNDLIRQLILVNLLEGNWEYDIAKFYSIYESSFYESNYNIYPYDYEKVDLMGIKPIDSRDKNYEFGCKRLNHHVQGYQFSFYAPFYIDNKDDIPDCFKIKLEFDNNITKIINIHIGDNRGTWNYLRNYVVKYASKINDNVIYLLPETNQCSCDGINVKYGGFAILKDDQIGQIYYNQMTINLFDNIITETFKRTKMVMKQIIPLAFMFNINDFLEGSEKRRLKDHPVKITGAYYKNGIKLPFYAFDNNYTNYKIHSYLFDKQQYKDINENIITNYVKTKQESQSLTSLPYPSLHEADYYKYKYTNKLNCMYCPWKLKYSSDTNPYIFNMTFAFKHYSKNDLVSSNIYGEFPVFIDTIKPYAIFTPNTLTDLTLSYINTNNEADHDLYIDENMDIEQYYKIRNNHVCDWFTPYNKDTFLNEENWTPVNNNKCYHKGILYNLSYFDPINQYDETNIDENLTYLNMNQSSKIDKFGVFINFNMENFDINDMAYIKPTEFIMSYSYNSLYNMRASITDGIIDPIIKTDEEIDNEYAYSYTKPINVLINTNKILTDTNLTLGDIFSYRVVNADEYGNEHFIIPSAYETSYDLNSYYIDYSEVFSNGCSINIIDSNINVDTNMYGYMALPLTYTNISENINNFFENENNKLYYSRNESLEYIELNSDEMTTISDLNVKYTFYKKYPIVEQYNASKYIYSPVYDDGDNIYSDAILLNSNYYENKLNKLIYIDEYDLEKFVESYNSIYDVKLNPEEVCNDINSYTISYARFTNVEHLQKWPKYISRDKNDEFIEYESNMFDNIFIRERFISYNMNVYDRYTPISYALDISNEREYQKFVSSLKQEDIYFYQTTKCIEYDKNSNSNVIKEKKKYYDIFFKKKFYALKEVLYKAIMQDNTISNIIPLQLYVKNYNDTEKIKEQFIYITSNGCYDNNGEMVEMDYSTLVDISEYLIPLFSNIYIEDSTKQDIYNIAFSGNVLSDIIDDNPESAKYIFFNKFHKQCMISLKLYTEYNFIKYDQLNIPVYTIKDFINLNSNIYPDNLGDEMKLNYLSDTDIIITFMHYNDKKDKYEKYGMYFINVNCSNTKHSFRFRDTSSMIFYTIENQPLENENLYKLIPYINSNIFSDFLGRCNTLILPYTFILKSKYIPVINQNENSINRYNYWTSHDNSENVYDIKFLEQSKGKIKLNRYTDYITPIIKEVDNYLYNRFTKIFKLTDQKFNERNYEGIDINIYKHNNLRIGLHYDYEKNIPTIRDVDLIEYKHFNDNYLYNLEESFIVELNELLSYDELLEKETFIETFKIFKNRLHKYNTDLFNQASDQNKILFLYNRYNISYISEVKKLNLFKDKKLYTLKYKFTLI